MKRLLTIAFSLIAGALGVCAQLTLEYCQERAEANYPLIKKYDLVRQTADIELSDIDKGWLPKVNVYVQGTVQNIVPSFPKSLNGMLTQMGTNLVGINKLQYKAGVDVNQTIWDGGNAKSQRAVTKARLAEQEASLAVEMYTLRDKIQKLYFGILLLQEQISKIEATCTLLKSNHELIVSMVKNGVAMQSDADMVEAQRLSLNQKLTEARNSRQSYLKLLGIYIDEEIGNRTLVRPTAAIPTSGESSRPELALFESRLRVNSDLTKAVDVSLMPRIGFFAQAYYGYPGFNYFENMLNRNLSFNVIAGVKASWNLDCLYSNKNTRRKLALSSENIKNDRELFLFNTRLKSEEERMTIEGMEDVIRDDARIVELRSNVRRAAESKLRNGVIDATELLGMITDETQARLASAYHEIQLIQYIYQLKQTLNR